VKPEVNDEELRAIERELSQVLAVEPSPEFAARVRARIEQQPAPAFGWSRWAIASFAAAAVIFVTVVAVTRRTPAGHPVVTVHADVTLPHDPDRVPESRTADGRETRRIRPVRTAQPEIMIDPSLAQAIRRLVAEQRVLPEVPPGPSLEPVVVEPLKVPEIAGTGGAGL